MEVITLQPPQSYTVEGFDSFDEADLFVRKFLHGVVVISAMTKGEDKAS